MPELEAAEGGDGDAGAPHTRVEMRGAGGLGVAREGHGEAELGKG